MASIFRKFFGAVLAGLLLTSTSLVHASPAAPQKTFLWRGNHPFSHNSASSLNAMFWDGDFLRQEQPKITPRKEPNPFARRTEVVFFIALGFSIFYSRLLNSLYANANALTLNAVGYGDIEGEEILMSVLGEPIEDYRPINLFLWVNSLTWPFAITFNSVVENFDKQDNLFPRRFVGDQKSRNRYRVRMHYYQSSF